MSDTAVRVIHLRRWGTTSMKTNFLPGDEISLCDHSIALGIAPTKLLEEMQRLDTEKAGVLYMDIYHTCDEAPIFRMKPTPTWKDIANCPECEREGPLILSFNYVLAVGPGREIEERDGTFTIKKKEN